MYKLKLPLYKESIARDFLLFLKHYGRKVGSMKFLDNLSLILVIVGALNWGSIGLFGFDFVGFLFGGQMSMLSRIIFAVVGLAGLWTITLLFKDKVLPSDRTN